MAAEHGKPELDDNRQQNEGFAPKDTKADNQMLRRMIARTTRELRVRNHDLEILMKNIPGGVYRCHNDPYLTFIQISSGFLTMLGYTEKEVQTLFQNRLLGLVYPPDKPVVLQRVKEQLSVGKEVEVEYRLCCKDGTLRWVLDKGQLCTTEDGIESLFCLMVDITKSRQKEEALRLSLERHRIIMDQATDVIFEWDILGDALAYSSNWIKKFGYSPITSNIKQSIPKSKNIHPDDVTTFKKLMEEIAAGVPYCETELRIMGRHGAYGWFRVRATAQYNDEQIPVKAVGVLVDIDYEKRQKEFWQAQAQRDALTGLYNKRSIEELAQNQLSASTCNAQALLILDVDAFKAVNDTYGHLCGDRVLLCISKALQEKFRSSDLIGRIGGDEFLLFLPEVTGKAAIEKKAQEALKAIASIVPKEGAAPISCSIGAAYAVRGNNTYLELFEQADHALYHVKKTGGGSFAFYDVACSDGCSFSIGAHNTLNGITPLEKEQP